MLMKVISQLLTTCSSPGTMSIYFLRSSILSLWRLMTQKEMSCMWSSSRTTNESAAELFDSFVRTSGRIDNIASVAFDENDFPAFVLSNEIRESCSKNFCRPLPYCRRRNREAWWLSHPRAINHQRQEAERNVHRYELQYLPRCWQEATRYFQMFFLQ